MFVEFLQALMQSAWTLPATLSAVILIASTLALALFRIRCRRTVAAINEFYARLLDGRTELNLNAKTLRLNASRRDIEKWAATAREDAALLHEPTPANGKRAADGNGQNPAPVDGEASAAPADSAADGGVAPLTLPPGQQPLAATLAKFLIQYSLADKDRIDWQARARTGAANLDSIFDYRSIVGTGAGLDFRGLERWPEHVYAFGIFTTFALLIIALQKPGEDLIPILSTKLVVSLTAIAASSVFAQEIRQGNDRFEKARRKLVEAVSLVYNVRYVTQGANERRQAINPPSPEPNPAVVPDKVEPPLQAPPEAYHLNKFISSLHNLQTLFGSNVKRLDQFVSAFKPLSDSVAALNEHFSGTNATLSNAVDKQLPELAAQIKNLAETLERRAGDPFMNGRETPVEPLDERRNEV